MNRLVFLVLFFCSSYLYAQVDPEIIVSNRISKAYYFETDIDSSGRYRFNDTLKYEVKYDKNGNTVVTKNGVNSKKGKLAIRWYHNQFDDENNKIEDFIIDQNYDSTFSDTLFHHKYDFKEGKIIRKRYIPHHNGKTFPPFITSYHYVREGFYFTYKADRLKNTGGVELFKLSRVEYRSDRNIDTIITLNLEVRKKLLYDLDDNFNLVGNVCDTINLAEPDTSISVVEKTLPKSILTQCINNSPKVNFDFNRVEVTYYIVDGEKNLTGVEFFNEHDKMYLKFRFREEEIRMLIEVFYTDDGLYIGAQKNYFPENRRWSRRVEYEKY